MISLKETWLRRCIWLLPVYALLTLWTTATHQPDPESDFRAWSEYVTTPIFFVGHVVGSILGAALLVLAVIALGIALSDTRRRRAARAGAVATVVGTAGALAMFGVAAFAQPAIGRAFLSGTEGARDIFKDVFDSATLVVAVPAVLLFSAGLALIGWSAASSPGLPKWVAAGLGLAGPLIGIIGLALGFAQTIGSLLLLTSGIAIARLFADDPTWVASEPNPESTD